MVLTGAQLDKFNIAVRQQMLELNGATIQAPTLQYRNMQNNSIISIRETMSGSWNLKSAKFCTPSGSKKWSWIELRSGPACDNTERAAFTQALGNGLKRYCGFRAED